MAQFTCATAADSLIVLRPDLGSSMTCIPRVDRTRDHHVTTTIATRNEIIDHPKRGPDLQPVTIMVATHHLLVLPDPDHSPPRISTMGLQITISEERVLTTPDDHRQIPTSPVPKDPRHRVDTAPTTSADEMSIVHGF